MSADRIAALEAEIKKNKEALIRNPTSEYFHKLLAKNEKDLAKLTQ